MGSFDVGALPTPRDQSKHSYVFPLDFVESCAQLLAGLFFDGVLQDMLNWQYPKGESTAQRMLYSIGSNDSTEGKLSWFEESMRWAIS